MLSPAYQHSFQLCLLIFGQVASDYSTDTAQLDPFAGILSNKAALYRKAEDTREEL